MVSGWNNSPPIASFETCGNSAALNSLWKACPLPLFIRIKVSTTRKTSIRVVWISKRKTWLILVRIALSLNSNCKCRRNEGFVLRPTVLGWNSLLHIMRVQLNSCYKNLFHMFLECNFKFQIKIGELINGRGGIVQLTLTRPLKFSRVYSVTLHSRSGSPGQKRSR